MRTTVLASIAAAALCGFGAGALTETAGAQQAPPPPGVAAPPGTAAPGVAAAPEPEHWGGRFAMRHAWMERLRTMALIYRPDDRALTPDDVRKIAEAFLLWNGNHTWKVTDVAPTQDNLVAFTVATGDGGVIARFTMDRKDGRLRRIG